MSFCYYSLLAESLSLSNPNWNFRYVKKIRNVPKEIINSFVIRSLEIASSKKSLSSKLFWNWNLLTFMKLIPFPWKKGSQIIFLMHNSGFVSPFLTIEVNTRHVLLAMALVTGSCPIYSQDWFRETGRRKIIKMNVIIKKKLGNYQTIHRKSEHC